MTKALNWGTGKVIAEDPAKILNWRTGKVIAEDRDCSVRGLVKKVIREKLEILSADLSELNLRDIDFSDSNFAGSIFKGSDLFWASFESSYLKGVNFEGANLDKVSFKNSDCEYVSFKGSYLPRADFTGAYIGGVDFTGCDLSTAKFDQVIEDLKSNRTDEFKMEVINCALRDSNSYDWPKNLCLERWASVLSNSQELEDEYPLHLIGWACLGDDFAKHFYSSYREAKEFLKGQKKIIKKRELEMECLKREVDQYWEMMKGIGKK